MFSTLLMVINTPKINFTYQSGQSDIPLTPFHTHTHTHIYISFLKRSISQLNEIIKKIIKENQKIKLQLKFSKLQWIHNNIVV